MKRFKAQKVYLLLFLILGVFLIAGCGGGGGDSGSNSGHWDDSDGGSSVDEIAPTVRNTSPLNNASGVAINTRVTATFSEAMDPATITATTFTLRRGPIAIAGTVSYSGINAVFTPASNLEVSTTYTATITTGARNVAGIALESNFVWTFTTGASADFTAPTVILTVPADVATGVAINTGLTATFSEAMDPLTITGTTFTLRQGITSVAGTVSYSGVDAVFVPTSNLTNNTTYTATITTGAQDLAGNSLASNFVWSFTTGSSTDTTSPTVILTNPDVAATGVCVNKVITATFSEVMDPLMINTTTFKVAGVTGTVLNVALTNSASFTPVGDLAANTTYTATITTGVKDVAGNSMAADYVWSFTTGTTTCTAAVALNEAAPFGTMGGSAGVTNDGLLTVINGDIGTTGASTLVTGLQDSVGDVYTITGSNDGMVNGRIYTAPPPPGGAGVGGTAATFAIAQAGLLAANQAYIDLSPASMPGGIDPGAGQLGGLTLPPGIYQAAGGSFLITGSDLTLDAGGDTEAVFVFQMASSLTVGAAGPLGSRTVNLINGAQAKNVFWQVGSAATINPAGGGTMVGTIIASDAISFNTTGNNTPDLVVTLEGRALALNASCTMTNTHINVPAQ